MINSNLIKFKNLASYLKIDKIDESNYDEVIDKFFVLPGEYEDSSQSTICFCGRPLKFYYYLINKTNNDVLIAGSGCKKIFEKNTKRFNDRGFKKYFNLNFKKGILIKIIDWNGYLESCINQYLIDIDGNEEFDDLLDKYKNNKFITDVINNGRKRRRIEQEMYDKEIMKQKERINKKMKENNREIVVYDIIRENSYCKIIF